MTPQTRGAVRVAAIFDTFLTIYQTRTADLLRLPTGGSGKLPDGAIHPDLVHLCDEASKSAKHVLSMIIRALEYLPPVDVTFFEFLRALITADFDLVPTTALTTGSRSLMRSAAAGSIRRTDSLKQPQLRAHCQSKPYVGGHPTALDARRTGTPSSGTMPSSPQDSNRARQ
jgi:hypothetical protein